MFEQRHLLCKQRTGFLRSLPCLWDKLDLLDVLGQRLPALRGQIEFLKSSHLILFVRAHLAGALCRVDASASSATAFMRSTGFGISTLQALGHQPGAVEDGSRQQGVRATWFAFRLQAEVQDKPPAIEDNEDKTETAPVGSCSQPDIRRLLRQCLEGASAITCLPSMSGYESNEFVARKSIFRTIQTILSQNPDSSF